MCVKPEIDRYSLCGEDLENFLLETMPESHLEGLVVKSWEMDERTRIGRDSAGEQQEQSWGPIKTWWTRGDA